MAFRELVVEAVKKSTLAAHSIFNRLQPRELKHIYDMQEMDGNYISDLAYYYKPGFDEFSDEDKQAIIEKIWNQAKSGKKPLEENPEENQPLSQSELKQKIMDYVKEHGAVLYPLESAAEDLATTLTSEEKAEEETKEEKCSCCGKSPCECGPDCECGCKESVTEAITNIKDLDKDQFISLIKNKLEVALYDGGYSSSERGQMLDGCTKLVKEYGLPEEDIKALESQYNVSLDDICPQCGSAKREGIGDTIRKIGDQIKQNLQNLPEATMPITEAVMNDIPHEIDDQIHTLKDMRFELEQTKKNWDIAGVETQPMDEVLTNIDGLIASLYQNGAKMADDEISKGSSETQEPEKEEE